MKNINIEEIITKMLLEEASSDELVLIENWRSKSIQNENLYQEYASIWDASANYVPQNFKPNVDSAYQKHLDLLLDEESKVINFTPKGSTETTIEKTKTRIFTFRRLASVAALFVLAFGAMFVLNNMNNTSITSESGVTFASLEDGSSIWLEEGSSLSYSKGFGEDHRNLKLEGKAFFDVARNEDVAFNISSNDIDVSVLGTSFTVDTQDGKNIVTVTSGKVAVKSDDQEVTLTKNEKIIFENNKFIEQSIDSEELVWRNSNLSFNNAPLNQVIADINLFHNNKIVLNSNVKNLDCPFTARGLADTSFEDIIEILKITYDIEAEDLDNGNVSLTISECK